MVSLIEIGLALFLFSLYWFRNPQFWSTDMYIGKKGCGKTCTLAKLALRYNKKGYKVYTNVEGISNTYFFNPKQLDTLTPDPNSIILIDEVGLVWDNRSFANFKANEWFKYSRQYKCKVILFSQAFDIDLKIRNLVDNMYLMTRIGKGVIYRPVVKKLGIVQKPDGTGDLADTYRYGGLLSWKFTYLPRYYGLFNTYNPPQRDQIAGALQASNDVYEVYSNFRSWLFFQIKSFFKLERWTSYAKRKLFRSKSNASR
jgi:hypothetical protein